MPCVSIPPGRDRHSCVLAVLARLSASVGSLWVCAFICGDLDGVTGDARNERTGLRGWRCGLCASLRSRIDLVMLSAGSTLGLRAPDCAKESSTLWTLFALRRDWVGADSWPLCAFAQAHWLCYAFRGEYAGAARPQTCAKESKVEAALPPLWTLFTLRRGWVGACSRRPSPGHTGRPDRL